MSESVLLAILELAVYGVGVAVGVGLGYALGKQRATRSSEDREVYDGSDSALQRIVVAKMALDLGDVDKARSALDAAVNDASDVATRTVVNGELRRSDSQGGSAGAA